MAASSQTPPTPMYLQQENDVTQECRDLLLSLPKEKVWSGRYFYQYQGFWFSPWILQGVLAFLQNFQGHDTDILLVTTPKSGTTWLKALMFALVNRRVHPPNSQHHPLLKNNPHVLVPFSEFMLYTEKNRVPTNLSSFTSPRLLQSHLPFVMLPKSTRESSCKIVYLCRNPGDTVVSLWHFLNKLKGQNVEEIPLEMVFDCFCKGVSHYGPFWDHVLGYWNESLERPQKVLFLKYEEMTENPTHHLKRLAEFLGYPFSPEEEAAGLVNDILRLCSLENLSNLEINKIGKLPIDAPNASYFRSGKVGDWKKYLACEMVDRLDQINKQKLHGSPNFFS